MIYHRIFTERSVKDGEKRIMTFVASDDTRDSYGTVLNPQGWGLKRFAGNPIIGYQHNIYYSADPDNVIGKGHAYMDGDKLMVDITFEPAEINEVADKVWKKLQFGSLNAVSVGFEEIGRGKFGEGDEAVDGKNPTYYFAGQELLEISIVNIPANPNALKNAFEEEGKRIAELRDQELKAAADAKAEAEKAEAEKKAAEAKEAAELSKQVTILTAEATLLI